MSEQAGAEEGTRSREKRRKQPKSSDSDNDTRSGKEAFLEATVNSTSGMRGREVTLSNGQKCEVREITAADKLWQERPDDQDQRVGRLIYIATYDPETGERMFDKEHVSEIPKKGSITTGWLSELIEEIHDINDLGGPTVESLVGVIDNFFDYAQSLEKAVRKDDVPPDIEDDLVGIAESMQAQAYKVLESVGEAEGKTPPDQDDG